jgi:hypothetical protein
MSRRTAKLPFSRFSLTKWGNTKCLNITNALGRSYWLLCLVCRLSYMCFSTRSSQPLFGLADDSNPLS